MWPGNFRAIKYFSLIRNAIFRKINRVTPYIKYFKHHACVNSELKWKRMSNATTTQT